MRHPVYLIEKSPKQIPELTVAVLQRSGEIVLTEMSQRFHIDHLGRVMDAALQGCQVVPT